MLDDAVLARRIHALEHQQHRPLAVGVEALLQFLKPDSAVGENRLHVLDVGRKTEPFGRIVVGKLEMPGLVDTALFDDLGELHLCLRCVDDRLIVAKRVQGTR